MKGEVRWCGPAPQAVSPGADLHGGVIQIRDGEWWCRVNCAGPLHRIEDTALLRVGGAPMDGDERDCDAAYQDDRG